MSDYIIPEEILVQVLKRLPAKSLVRSRSVCKWWKKLIDSPSFVLDHLALQKPQIFVANRYYYEPTFLLLDPQTLPLSNTLPHTFEKWPCRDFSLMGTLHGIVCFYEACTMRSGAYLWNPSIRKLSNVPIAEFMHHYCRDEVPDCRSPMATAFWIDPLTKHFKIVVYKKMYDLRSDLRKYGAIYSSIEGDWKEISPGELETIANYWLNNNPGLVMGKVAYWIALDVTPTRGVAISFDFEQERFGSIEGPFVAFDSYSSLYNRQGSLSLVYLDREKRCHVYSRQQGSWVNMFSIISLALNISRVYCIPKETEEYNKTLLAETTDDQLVLFDTNGSGCVTLKSADDKPEFYGHMAHGFVESLVFP